MMISTSLSLQFQYPLPTSPLSKDSHMTPPIWATTITFRIHPPSHSYHWCKTNHHFLRPSSHSSPTVFQSTTHNGTSIPTTTTPHNQQNSHQRRITILPHSFYTHFNPHNPLNPLQQLSNKTIATTSTLDQVGLHNNIICKGFWNAHKTPFATDVVLLIAMPPCLRQIEHNL